MLSIVARSITFARPAAATSVPLVMMFSFAEVKPVAPAPASGDSTAVVPAAADTVSVAVAIPTAADSLVLESRLTRAELRPALEQYFGRFNNDPALVRQVARAVLREAERQNVAPSLIAAVLVTENTTLKPAAESSVGATGLMQVMPMHAGKLGCDSADLVDVDSNICHGTKILARNLRRTKSASTALLRYNGCVRGTNTPDCHRYPGRVLARAGRLRQEILAAVEPRGVEIVAMAER
ncbi:MAG: transglycosylase SLT domain-containing protein [Gemmatimonadales bacterium]|nr:transglycosylase SLT domain-containing protein [Gemmatimonadales bacterium]